MNICRKSILFVVLAITAVAQPLSVEAAKILMHGRVEDPFGADSRGDGFILEHLESLFGVGNVTYLQGLLAEADGSSADGFDAVVISSSLGSNDIRGKYEDSPVGILFWENALLKVAAGEFQMSTESGNLAADPGRDRTMITIEDPSHPLAAGLSGDVEVFSEAAATQFARGELAPGVKLIGTMTGTDPAEYGIIAADTGDELLGDGSDGFPSAAPGRRVMFFLSDSTSQDVFPLLTSDGLKLFDAAIHWVANVPAVNPWDLNSDGSIDAADAGILFGAWGTNAANADKNGDGIVDAADAGQMFAAWTGDPANAVPEPIGIGPLVLAFAICRAGRCLKFAGGLPS